MTGMMIGSVNAAPSFRLGYIDVQKVLLSYEKAKRYQEQLMQKEQSLRDEITEKQKQAEKAKSRGASDEDVKNMLNKIEKDYEPKRLDIMQFKQKTEHEIKSDISGAVAAIATNMGIEMVANKQALVYVTNGIDLTDKVIELLNKKK